MNTFEKQIERMVSSFKALITPEGSLGFITKGLKEFNNNTEAFERMYSAFKTAGDSSIVSWGKAWYYVKLFSTEVGGALPRAKEMEKIVLGRASEQGIAGATTKLKEFDRISYKTFNEILTGEESARLELLRQNDTIDAQILKTKKLIEDSKERAILEANINIKSNDAQKAREAVLSLETKLIGLLKEQTKERERQKTDALENLASMEAFREKILSVKALNPAEQIERNNTALAAAKVRLEAATVGTKEWRTATKDLGDHVAKALENYKLVNDAINKAVDSQQRLNQAIIEKAKQKVEKGEEFQAEQLLRKHQEDIKYNQWFAENDEQRLKFIQQRIDLQKELVKIDENYYRYQKDLESLEKERMEIIKKIANEDMTLAQKAQKVWSSTEEDTRKFAEQAAETFKNYPTSIKEASELLNTNLNEGLVRTKQLIIDATKEMIALSNAIGGAGQTLGDLEKQLERQERRG
jgi:hypothetical protein